MVKWAVLSDSWDMLRVREKAKEIQKDNDVKNRPLGQSRENKNAHGFSGWITKYKLTLKQEGIWLKEAELGDLS